MVYRRPFVFFSDEKSVVVVPWTFRVTVVMWRNWVGKVCTMWTSRGQMQLTLILDYERIWAHSFTRTWRCPSCFKLTGFGSAAKSPEVKLDRVVWTKKNVGDHYQNGLSGASCNSCKTWYKNPSFFKQLALFQFISEHIFIVYVWRKQRELFCYLTNKKGFLLGKLFLLSN